MKIMMDLLVDVLGSLFIAIGVYNFAAVSEFPVTGVSGIALVIYYYWKCPIGIVTMILNVPIILCCGRILGIKFLCKSLKTMLISTFFMDIIAPIFPVYHGELMLSSICMGLFAGIGYALLYMRNTSTGGTDFITMTIRALNPHLSLGKIIMVMDCSVLLFCGMLMGGSVDKVIYGLIGTYIMSIVVDKVMYGMDSGKLVLVVTDRGHDVVQRIDTTAERGSTLLKATGGYSKEDKHVVMCACKSKQVHMVKRAVKEVDSSAFFVVADASQVCGNGFKSD